MGLCRVILVVAALSCLSFQSQAQTDTVYEYDALGRLVAVERKGAGKAIAYSYDAAGNRTSVAQETMPPAAFSVNDVSVAEGGVLSFTVSKADGAWQTYAVSYATANGSAGAGDYTSKSGTLSFAPSDTSKTVTVQTTQDSVYENAETVLLNLSSPTNGATIADSQGVGTITNDDAAPGFAINNVTRQEGQNLVFTVTKSGATALAHNVNYATQNGTAAAGSDYVAKSGTLSFAPSDASKTITIVGVEDSVVEPTETFRVNLSAATNGATIADSQGVGTIANDDNTPPVARNDSANTEVFELVSVYPLANDSDADGHTITLTGYTSSHGATIQWHASIKRMDITPTSSASSQWVDYTISDGQGGTDTGRINLNVSQNSSCGHPPCIPGGF